MPSPSSPGRGHVNAHTHLYSALAPLGMPPPEVPPATFLQILERIWWRLDRAIDRDILDAGARLYVAEALLAGATCLIDHHESPDFIAGSLDVIADACQELGMPAVLCYGATERNRGLAEAEQGLEECRRFVRDNQRPLVRGVVGLHASFTVSDETICQAADLARELGTVLHLHMAEGPEDLEDARSRGYAGPLGRLQQLDALIPGSIFAHGVHLTADEVRLCAEHDIWLVQNPRSNKGNRVGYPGNLHASPRVALGTDGYAADMAAEQTALLDEARAHGDNLDRAARRLDAGHELAALLFGNAGLPEAEVRDGAVRIAGRELVRDGALVGVDLDAIRARAKVQAERLWQRMAAL
jgi:cytosine/adenosine deaminase-related metal-dependent hydrolase